ncbi:MAG: type II secretion system protein [Candidatus Saccharibacteria bacterium]|nr:type II secretion system protein [Candidatus Saccharibacteria bacterium]
MKFLRSHHPAKFRYHSKSHRRGDTIIEVTIAITIFSVISAITIGLMSRNLSAIQGALELTMARNEIDAQAEALRFLHNSFASERELLPENRVYQQIWQEITTHYMNNPARIASSNLTDCKSAYEGSHTIYHDKAFIVNTRRIDPGSVKESVISSITNNLFSPTSLYPRIIFSRGTGYFDQDANSDKLQESDPGQDSVIYDGLARAEGIWVIASRDVSSLDHPENYSDDALKSYIPQYYDFHIRTCWYAPGQENPSTIATIIRLYNPEYTEKSR